MSSQYQRPVLVVPLKQGDLRNGECCVCVCLLFIVQISSKVFNYTLASVIQHVLCCRKFGFLSRCGHVNNSGDVIGNSRSTKVTSPTT